MTRTILSLLLNAAVVFAVARLTPGVRIKGYGTAVAVAAVYALLAWALKALLVFLTFPLVLLSFGLFLLVINAFLLWLTDKLVDGIEIQGPGPLAMATVGITVGGVLVRWLM